MTTTTTAEVGGKTVALGRAAQQLELKRGEFDLAVQLGLVRTVREDLNARPRVAQEEIERIRSAEGFPEVLRERVRVVGTAEASQLLAVPAHRFTRLARGGHFTPVKCYLNRYRAVVWLYLAEELTDLALRHPQLLNDRQLPKETLARLGAGEDRRPRNWRGRRAAMLLQQTEDPWERAAGIASALDAAHLAEVVTDPYERAYLTRLRPETVRVGPDSPAAREIIERLQLAQDPDEVLWYRMDLAQHLSLARSTRPAPRPMWERPVIDAAATTRPAHVPAPAASSGTLELKRSELLQREPKESGREPAGVGSVGARSAWGEPAGGRPVEARAGHGRLRRGLARLRRPRTAARSTTTAP
ncbi:DUF6397 family protein [Streptomyces sp. NPDC023838]|uniref:DUF6397 family protein n=1 Tax=Streptomyces sp. NPDC023838 TaxID=3154325 RepID=UPI0033D44C69